MNDVSKSFFHGTNSSVGRYPRISCLQTPATGTFLRHMHAYASLHGPLYALSRSITRLTVVRVSNMCRCGWEVCAHAQCQGNPPNGACRKPLISPHACPETVPTQKPDCMRILRVPTQIGSQPWQGREQRCRRHAMSAPVQMKLSQDWCRCGLS